MRPGRVRDWLGSIGLGRRMPLRAWSEHRLAATVAALFLVAGFAWVLFTDLLLYGFTRNAVLVARFETAKGWTFVLLAAALVYAVTYRAARRYSRAQATMAAVVESIADGVLLLGADRSVRHANPAAMRLLGCDKLVGMTAEEFSRRFRVSYPNGALVPPHEYASQRVFEEGGPLRYKALIFPAQGGERTIWVTAAAVRDKAREPASLAVSVMHDVTDSERLEQLRDQFLATAAHSLKTPVAVIKANVQAMGGSEGHSTLPQALAVIERQCVRIDRIVQNLLVIARIRSGSLKLRMQALALRTLVTQVAQQTARAWPRNELNYEMRASPRVRGDRERLGLAVSDLLDGALQSSASGCPVTVLLEARRGHADVGVRYKPFLAPEERVEGTPTEYDELGIGRLVVETIAAAHGGEVRHESEGTDVTAWIRLPAESEAEGDA